MRQDQSAVDRLGDVFTRCLDPMYVWRATGEGLVLVAYNAAADVQLADHGLTLLGRSSAAMFGLTVPVIHDDLTACHTMGAPTERELDFPWPNTAEPRRLHATYTPIGSGLVLATVRDVSHFRDRADEQADRATELEQLTEMTRALLRSTPGQVTRDLLCAAALEVSGADIVYLLEATATHLVQTAEAHLPEVTEHTLHDVPLEGSDGSLARLVYRSHHSMFVDDIAADLRANLTQRDSTPAACGFFEAVLADDRIVGVLIAAWLFPMPAPPQQVVRLMPLLAAHAGLAIARADLLERLADEAAQDPLTGLPNRRAADVELARQLSQARRSHRPLTVCVLDIDGLKAVNDALGHEAGDALLLEASRAWRDALRAEDQLARVGGDEFVIVMPDTDAAAAATTLDRLRGAAPHISVAAGLAIWDGRATKAQVLAAADSAMYEDKRTRQRSTESARAAEIQRLPEP